MLPARKPTKKQASFAASVRKKIMSGKSVPRGDLMRAMEIERAGIEWRKKINKEAKDIAE